VVIDTVTISGEYFNNTHMYIKTMFDDNDIYGVLDDGYIHPCFSYDIIICDYGSFLHGIFRQIHRSCIFYINKYRNKHSDLIKQSVLKTFKSF